MSASRTLLRRRKDADQRPDGEGGQETYRRVKPATRDRRVMLTYMANTPKGPREIRHHATKGFRVCRP